MLLMFGIGDGLEEELEARDAADVLGWRAAGTVEISPVSGS